MSQQDVEKLLDRYLNGTATDEEKQQVETWLERTGEPNAEWQQLGESGREQWLSALFADIQEQTGTGAKVVPLARKPQLWRNIAAIAAVFILIFAGYLAWPLIGGKHPAEQLTSLKTSSNQKRQIKLADGSQIWVNAGSELKYPQTFNGKTREVYLSGEAYFDIKHDASRPFLIHSGSVITTVLGTAFDIKEDQHNHTIVVTVTRGKVSVSQDNKVLGILTPNQQLSFNVQNQHAEQQQVDASQAIAWQQNDVHFEDLSFAEAATILEKRFNTHIIFSNEKVKKCRFTGTSLGGNRLDQILKVICALNNATYQKRTDGSILIDGPGCEQ